MIPIFNNINSILSKTHKISSHEERVSKMSKRQEIIQNYKTFRKDLEKCIAVDEFISSMLSQLPQDSELSVSESNKKETLLSMKEDNTCKMDSISESLYFYEAYCLPNIGSPPYQKKDE